MVHKSINGLVKTMRYPRDGSVGLENATDRLQELAQHWQLQVMSGTGDCPSHEIIGVNTPDFIDFWLA